MGSRLTIQCELRYCTGDKQSLVEVHSPRAVQSASPRTVLWNVAWDYITSAVQHTHTYIIHAVSHPYEYHISRCELRTRTVRTVLVRGPQTAAPQSTTQAIPHQSGSLHWPVPQMKLRALPYRTIHRTP